VWGDEGAKRKKSFGRPKGKVKRHFSKPRRVKEGAGARVSAGDASQWVTGAGWARWPREKLHVWVFFWGVVFRGYLGTDFRGGFGGLWGLGNQKFIGFL